MKTILDVAYVVALGVVLELTIWCLLSLIVVAP